MKSGLNLGLKQTQKLIMTQTLRQSIEMLQMTNLELSELISQEFLENPVLEEASSSQTEDYLEEKLNQNLNGDEGDSDAPEKDIYDDRNESGINKQYEDEDKNRLYIENAVTTRESLKEHLLWQATMTADTSGLFSVYEEIITMLDDDGFLDENLFNSISHKSKSAVLKSIHNFDPVGCGAFSMKQTLYLQACYFYPEDQLLHLILGEHFDDIEKLDYGRISKALSVPESVIIEKSKTLHNLNPFPGRSFSGREAKPVIPDVEVKLFDDEIIVTLNDDWIPSVKLSTYYINLLKKKSIDKEQREYISSRLQSAMALLKNISSRRDTILKVTSAIMTSQKDFLLHGPGHLKYLTHHDVADEVSVHESTVSRVSSGKYVQTPWGVFELKYFFVSRLKNSGDNSSDDDQSSDQVRMMIQDIINGENPENPFSDEEVVNLLKGKGVKVARRTVAKYRDILNIPASNKRKKINMIKS